MPADPMKAVKRAQASYERAWATRDAAVLQAHAAGNSMRAISRATGMSVEGVSDLVKRGGKNRRRST